VSQAIAASLATGDMTVHGRIVNASNNAMLVEVGTDDGAVLAVYKPLAGERPLWDFAYGTLHLREVAAYEVSNHLGWDLVPETVLRDGPFGEGSVQRFIDHDPRCHYFALLDDPRHHEALRQMAAFDLVVNNADRKGGHVLRSPDQRIFGCDHGLTFHVEPKLRTVIWEFGGTPVDRAWQDDLRRLSADAVAPGSGLTRRLAPLIAPNEIEMLARRAAAVASAGVLPDVAEDERPYPWPPI